MSHDRFNEFHLRVACISEHLRWVLSKIDPSDSDAQAGFDVLAGLLDDLEVVIASYSHGPACEL
jgi:hypothetical protein